MYGEYLDISIVIIFLSCSPAGGEEVITPERTVLVILLFIVPLMNFSQI